MLTVSGLFNREGYDCFLNFGINPVFEYGLLAAV